jgi:hypothetical protein
MLQHLVPYEADAAVAKTADAMDGLSTAASHKRRFFGGGWIERGAAACRRQLERCIVATHVSSKTYWQFRTTVPL